MKQVLMALFLTLILSFSIVGVTQSFSEADDAVENEDSNEIKVN
ncbi:hypothetical protein [Lentibacillus amyloliquefaciens]|nr:hypothetical protein [Lentibacillus amyloliquefaciens]